MAGLANQLATWHLEWDIPNNFLQFTFKCYSDLKYMIHDPFHIVWLEKKIQILLYFFNLWPLHLKVTNKKLNKTTHKMWFLMELLISCLVILSSLLLNEAAIYNISLYPCPFPSNSNIFWNRKKNSYLKMQFYIFLNQTWQCSTRQWPSKSFWSKVSLY